jgi:hypothetical protein
VPPLLLLFIVEAAAGWRHLESGVGPGSQQQRQEAAQVLLGEIAEVILQ